jgi:hypothetical protein
MKKNTKYIQDNINIKKAYALMLFIVKEKERLYIESLLFKSSALRTFFFVRCTVTFY